MGLEKFLKGLPNGANNLSIDGFKSNSKDVNNPYNVIPSNHITMKEDDGTPLRKGPILGTDDLGNRKLMMPGNDYIFPGSSVTEIPMAHRGKRIKPKLDKRGAMGILEDRSINYSRQGPTPITEKQENFFMDLAGIDLDNLDSNPAMQRWAIDNGYLDESEASSLNDDEVFSFDSSEGYNDFMKEGGRTKPPSDKMKKFITDLKFRNANRPYLGRDAFIALQSLKDYGYTGDAPVVTSMLRGKANKVYKKKSSHNTGKAFDVSAKGEKGSKEFLDWTKSGQGQQWLSDFGIEYIDETSDKKRKAVGSKGTAPHHHFAFKKDVNPQIDSEKLSNLISEFDAYKNESGYVNMEDYPGFQTQDLGPVNIYPSMPPKQIYIPKAESTGRLQDNIISQDYEEKDLTDQQIKDLRAQGYEVEEMQTGGEEEPLNIAQEGGTIEEQVYSMFPALQNMGEVTFKADPEFTREITGKGDIEYFSPKRNRTQVTYPNGFIYSHPKPGTHGIVYNPETNDAQGIALDMLHGLSKDDNKYNRLRNKFKRKFLTSKFKYDIERDWDEKLKEEGKGDGKSHFINNHIDGIIRTLLFEGTPEDFEKNRYWEGARESYLSQPELKETFTELEDYLKTPIKQEGGEYRKGGYVVEELPKAQYGKATDRIPLPLPSEEQLLLSAKDLEYKAWKEQKDAEEFANQSYADKFGLGYKEPEAVSTYTSLPTPEKDKIDFATWEQQNLNTLPSKRDPEYNLMRDSQDAGAAEQSALEAGFDEEKFNEYINSSDGRIAENIFMANNTYVPGSDDNAIIPTGQWKSNEDLTKQDKANIEYARYSNALTNAFKNPSLGGVKAINDWVTYGAGNALASVGAGASNLIDFLSVDGSIMDQTLGNYNPVFAEQYGVIPDVVTTASEIAMPIPFMGAGVKKAAGILNYTGKGIRNIPGKLLRKKKGVNMADDLDFSVNMPASPVIHQASSPLRPSIRLESKVPGPRKAKVKPEDPNQLKMNFDKPIEPPKPVNPPKPIEPPIKQPIEPPKPKKYTDAEIEILYKDHISPPKAKYQESLTEFLRNIGGKKFGKKIYFHKDAYPTAINNAHRFDLRLVPDEVNPKIHYLRKMTMKDKRERLRNYYRDNPGKKRKPPGAVKPPPKGDNPAGNIVRESKIPQPVPKKLPWKKWNPETVKDEAIMAELKELERTVDMPDFNTFEGSLKTLSETPLLSKFAAEKGISENEVAQMQYLMSKTKAYKKFSEDELWKTFHGSQKGDLRGLNVSENVKSKYNKGLYQTDDWHEAYDLSGMRGNETGKIYHLGHQKKDVLDLTGKVLDKNGNQISLNEIETAITKYTDPNLLPTKQAAYEKYAKNYNKKVDELFDWEKKAALDAYATKETIPSWMLNSKGEIPNSIAWPGSKTIKWTKSNDKARPKNLLGNKGTFDTNINDINQALLPIMGAGALGAGLSEKALGGEFEEKELTDFEIAQLRRQGYEVEII